MKITIYELLGLIKEGKAPKKIYEITTDKFKCGYKFNPETQWYETFDETAIMNIFEKNRLNNEVEIIEESEKIEKIDLYNNFEVMGENCNDKLDANFTDISDKINKLIDEINKLKEDK